MDYQVTLSMSARRDLEEIVCYISLDAPERAMKFGRFLISIVKLLGTSPEMGRVVPEFGSSDIREMMVRSYRVIYRVNHENHKIEIIRFWHGGRGMPNLS